MITEAFTLKGKTISEAFVEKQSKGDILHLRFTDGTVAEIQDEQLDDEITGKTFAGKRLEIDLHN